MKPMGLFDWMETMEEVNHRLSKQGETSARARRREHRRAEVQVALGETVQRQTLTPTQEQFAEAYDRYREAPKNRIYQRGFSLPTEGRKPQKS